MNAARSGSPRLWDITATFVGNATTLITAGGLTSLTDPNFLHRGLDHGLPVVTTPHAARRLQHRGFVHALGLPTWQHHVITKGAMTLTLTSLPGRHARGWSQRLLPPARGTMLEPASDDGSPRRRLCISGDTLLIEELNEIPHRFDPIDLGLLHLGGTPGRPAGDFRSG